MNLEKMTLEEKVGQLFMVGFHGLAPTENIKNLISKYNAGGICYFSRNLDSPKQVHNLSNELQGLANIPLFLSIDQEGGMVLRITDGVTVSPSNMAFGAIDDTSSTREMAEIIASELAEMGINMNFAPVLDVNNNPKNPVIGVRSYGENSEIVSRHGSEVIAGFQSANVSAVAKHFPGHGDTDVDSHLALPVVNHSLARLETVELPPFVRAINNHVDAIMVSHVFFPSIEETYPATMSGAMISGLLRDTLGFAGLVITDCMEMKAIDDHYSSGESAIKAIQAGADIVLISHTYEKQVQAIEAVIQAVETNEISEQRINESVRRILALKDKRQMHPNKPFHKEYFQRQRADDLARTLYDKSITLVKDDQKIIPLDGRKKTVLLWPTMKGTTVTDAKMDETDTLEHYLKGTFTNFNTLALSQGEEAIKKCADADQIIIATYNMGQNAPELNTIQEIIRLHGEKAVVCSFGNPYDLNDFPAVGAYLVAYDIRPMAQHSIAKVLTGEIFAEGKLPVSIHDTDVISSRTKM